jgi:hypothetical protein
MCDSWANDFTMFFNYITKLDNFGAPGYSIDRIDNDGNYEPGNIKMSTRHEQSANVKKRADNTSGYTGVTLVRNRFLSRIRMNGKAIVLGYYDTPEEAVMARNEYIIDNELTEYPIQKTAHGKDM